MREDIESFWAMDELVCKVCRNYVDDKCRVLEEDLPEEECPCLGYSQLKNAYLLKGA